MNAGHYPELTLPDAPGYDFARLHAQWVGDPYQPEAGTAHYYEVKAQIAAWIKPQRVVEIGVRAGYSALAFHMGHPFTEFYGMDLDDGQWGGEAGYLKHAHERLTAVPGLSWYTERCNSQGMKSLHCRARNADLFHVDGDHSPKGAAHDIILALVNGARHIVVDDYDFTPHVAEGADWCIQRFKLTAWYVGDGGYRGNVVIRGRS